MMIRADAIICKKLYLQGKEFKNDSFCVQNGGADSRITARKSLKRRTVAEVNLDRI